MFIDSETIEDAFDREKAKITNRRSVNVPQLILCALEIKISIELFDLIREKAIGSSMPERFRSSR